MLHELPDPSLVVAPILLLAPILVRHLLHSYLCHAGMWHGDRVRASLQMCS